MQWIEPTAGSGTMARPRKPTDEKTRIAQMLEAFRVYRTSTLLEVLDRPRTFAFVDGLVVTGVVEVISADPYGLVLQVERAQTAALERAQTVLLESPLHGASYRATVDLVDHRRAYVSLSGLEPFGNYEERRAQSRAAPAIPLLAKVFGHGETATGRVVDLSSHALAGDFERSSFDRVAGAPVVRLDVWGEEVTAAPLPDFEIDARIRRSTRSEGSEPAACRVVLAFDPYPALERVLRRYVARRQRDVMLELTAADIGAKVATGSEVIPDV